MLDSISHLVDTTDVYYISSFEPMQTDTERSELVGGCYRRLAVKDGVADFIADISSNSFSQGVGTLAVGAATKLSVQTSFALIAVIMLELHGFQCWITTPDDIPLPETLTSTEGLGIVTCTVKVTGRKVQMTSLIGVFFSLACLPNDTDLHHPLEGSVASHGMV